MTRILFFGRLRDVAGCSQFACELPPDVVTVADLRTWLAQRDPLVGEAIHAPGVRVAVNQSFCADNSASARNATEIAFMSPLSGG
jgi:molybdopterin synthase sulfur carrier subunit